MCKSSFVFLVGAPSLSLAGTVEPYYNATIYMLIDWTHRATAVYTTSMPPWKSQLPSKDGMVLTYSSSEAISR